jgi:purine-cytosine permease-like protein
VLIDLGSYQNFLFLLGSFFVPLFGVLLADWLLAGRHYEPADIFDAPNARPDMLFAWLAGFALYQWLSPVGPGWWTRLVEHTHPAAVTFTASLPSLATSFAAVLVLRGLAGAWRKRSILASA